MKRIIALVLMTALLAWGAALGEVTEPVSLRFAAQEEGTAAYSYAYALQTAMLDVLPDGSEIELTEDSPGGVGAPVFLSNGNTDLIMSNSVPAKESYTTGLPGQEITENIAALAGGLGQDFVNVMFTRKFVEETGITTIEEVAERQYPIRLICKKEGTLGELTAERVFEALGVSFDDIIAWGGAVERTSGDKIVSSLQEDAYDMTIDHVGVGQSNTTTLCLTHEMVDVQMGDELLERLREMGYADITVAPNTWNGQTEAIRTVGSQQCVLVRADMDEALACLLTQAICEEKDLLAAMVPAMKSFDPANAGDIAITGVPLHPGAERYYRENGLLD